MNGSTKVPKSSDAISARSCHFRTVREGGRGDGVDERRVGGGAVDGPKVGGVHVQDLETALEVSGGQQAGKGAGGVAGESGAWQQEGGAFERRGPGDGGDGGQPLVRLEGHRAEPQLAEGGLAGRLAETEQVAGDHGVPCQLVGQVREGVQRLRTHRPWLRCQTRFKCCHLLNITTATPHLDTFESIKIRRKNSLFWSSMKKERGQDHSLPRKEKSRWESGCFFSFFFFLNGEERREGKG